jgi:hypothetical protein
MTGCYFPLKKNPFTKAAISSGTIAGADHHRRPPEYLHLECGDASRFDKAPSCGTPKEGQAFDLAFVPLLQVELAARRELRSSYQ